MPIVERGRSWFLQSPGSTYALGVTPEGYLEHRHWGARITPCDLAPLRPWTVRSFTVNAPEAPNPDLSLETRLFEYPTAGIGDFRQPAIEVEHPDGARVLRLKYAAHRIQAGKPGLPGLPATYVEAASEADTLEIDLRDELGAVTVTLSYTVYAERNVVTRSVRVSHGGLEPIRLLRVFSASVDLGERPGWDWLHLSGAWIRERQVVTSRLRPGIQAVESVRGASSHQHNPFFALLAPQANEDQGEVFGFSLVYSGNFTAGIDLDHYGTARCQIGINPQGFSWWLGQGESFQSPEAVLVYSGSGLGGMSRTYHALYRSRLCRGLHRDRARPVVANNWEATYFDFDEARLLDLARRARGIGVELFVLDDGWFGKRDHDRCSLGDWVADSRKLPGGLAGLAAKLEQEGLQFGLWFEPEMVSKDSELYRLHPDWALQVPGRSASPGRHQFVLDFSRPDVCAAIHVQVASVLRSAPIRYVKWDANRHLSEVASAGRDARRQGETAHRHILGLYSVLERLVAEFPAVLFESCSGGGGRFDPGLLYYMPQTWTSDNTDAISRLRIQHGTSLVYPLSAMVAHVSAVPNHQVGRTTPLATRALVAMTGSFGLEFDFAKATGAELEELAAAVGRFKAWRDLLGRGDHYRLKSPFEGQEAAWMVVAPDQAEALVVHVQILAEGNAPTSRLRLRGLRPGGTYREAATGESAPADVLMAHGWVVESRADFHARVWHLTLVS